MEKYLEEIEGWISQVRDEEASVEDYNFLDRVSHGKPEGSDGLANVGTYLAIYEEDGDLKVDQDLVEELDGRHGSSRRKRFQNIVYDAKTEKREGKTLKDREVDGHERLQTMVDEFRENAEPRSRGDSHMTEENEDNKYDKAVETLDTLGGYAFAAAAGPLNVPATIVGVGVDHLQGDEEGQEKGTKIDVRRMLSEDSQKDISEGRDSNMKGQKDGYRVEGQNKDLYSENLEDENFNGSMEVVYGRGHTFEDPAELAAAAEEGELGVDRFLEIASDYDLDDDEEAYLVGQGTKMLAEDMAQDLEESTEDMLQEKYIADDIMDSVTEELGTRKEKYVDHMEDMAAGFLSVYRHDQRSKQNVEEARRNLEGLVRDGAEAVRDSNVQGLIDLERSIEDELNDN